MMQLNCTFLSGELSISLEESQLYRVSVVYLGFSIVGPILCFADGTKAPEPKLFISLHIAGQQRMTQTPQRGDLVETALSAQGNDLPQQGPPRRPLGRFGQLIQGTRLGWV